MSFNSILVRKELKEHAAYWHILNLHENLDIEQSFGISKTCILNVIVKYSKSFYY